jgi:hypothetical protein
LDNIDDPFCGTGILPVRAGEDTHPTLYFVHLLTTRSWLAADSETDETDIADGWLVHLFIRFIRYQNPLPTSGAFLSNDELQSTDCNFFLCR